MQHESDWLLAHLLDASKGIEYCRIGFELLNELKPDGADCFHNQAPEEESLSLRRPGIKRSASLGDAAQLPPQGAASPWA